MSNSTDAAIHLDGSRRVICNECGTARTVSPRYPMGGGRNLRCVGCENTTYHLPVDRGWPERENSSTTIRSLMFAIDVWHRVGAKVDLDAPITPDPADGDRCAQCQAEPLVQLWRMEDDGTFWVRVGPAPATLQDEALRWAWRHIMTADTWLSAPLCRWNRTGRRMRGIHRTCG